MCVNKENYFETISWIENLIDSCLTLDQEMNARKVIRTFEKKLLNDNNVNTYLFGTIVNRLNDKIDKQYKLLIKEYITEFQFELEYFF